MKKIIQNQSNNLKVVLIILILFITIKSNAQPTLTGPSSVCINQTNTYVVNVPFGYTGPANADAWVLSGTASRTLTHPGMDYTTGYLTLTSAGYVDIYVICRNDNNQNVGTQSRRITAIAPYTISISGPKYLCAGNTYNYTISANPGAANYQYTFPSGCTIDGNTSPYTTSSSSINLNVGSTGVSGQICVTALGLPCGSPSACTPIVVSSTIPNEPGSITAIVDDKPCPGLGWNLSISSVANADYYNWTYTNHSYFTMPDGIGTTQDLIPIGQSYSKTTTVSVSACTGCGCSVGRTKNLTTWTQQQCGNLMPQPANNNTVIEKAPDYKLYSLKNDALSAKLYTSDDLIKVYPNPANDILYVNVPESNNEFTIKICNIIGEIVFQKELNTEVTEIKTNDLKNGIYMVTISNSSFFECKKIIINK